MFSNHAALFLDTV